MRRPRRNEHRFISEHPVADWFAGVAGGRADLLARASSGRKSLAAMGGVILTTACLAAISATFALHMAVGAPWWAAALLGVGWGAVILNLDRMLVLGMGHEHSLKRNLVMAVPRLLLAAILGTIISTPLTLQIFDREIAAQISVIHQERRTEFDGTLKDLDTQIAAARARVEADNRQIAGGARVDPSQDKRVVAAQADVQSKQQVADRELASYNTLAAKAQAEFDGSGGTGVAGDGPQYRAALALAQQQKVISDQAASELAAAQQTLLQAQAAARTSADQGTTTQLDAANKDLAEATPALADLVKEKDTATADFTQRNADNTGLLIRLEALDDLGSKDGTMFMAQIALWLLFFCIEILPVMMKTLVNLGPETAYTTLAKRAEEDERAADDAQRAEVESERERAANQRRVKLEAASLGDQLIVDNERDRVEHQRTILTDINKQVAEEQRRVVTDALGVWAAHARRESERRLDEYERQVAARSAAVEFDPAEPQLPYPPTIDDRTTHFPPIVTAKPGRWGRKAATGRPVGPPADSEYVSTVGLPPESELG